MEKLGLSDRRLVRVEADRETVSVYSYVQDSKGQLVVQNDNIVMEHEVIRVVD